MQDMTRFDNGVFCKLSKQRFAVLTALAHAEAISRYITRIQKCKHKFQEE